MAVFADRCLDSEIEGVGDDRMADAHLVEQREALIEEVEVGEVEVVAGVEAYSASERLGGSRDERRDSLLGILGEEVSIGLGVELHSVGADSRGLLHLLGIRVDKDGGADSGLTEAEKNFLKEFGIGLYIPAGTGGKGVGGIGNKSHLLGSDLYHKAQEIIGRIALDVEFGCDDLSEVIYVAACDMPLIGTRMDRNSLRAELFAVDGEFNDIGNILAASVAQRGDLVYVNTECGHAQKLF